MSRIATRKNYFILGAILTCVVSVSILFTYVHPQEIVTKVGITNSYLIVFLIAALGGLSSLTGTAYFTALATFGAGVPSSYLIGLAGGLGVFISDTIFYFLAAYGRESIPQHWESTVLRVSRWTERWPRWALLVGVYVYISFTPLPNDLLVLVLVIAGYKYREIWWVILLGSFTISTLIAYFGNNVFG